MSNFLMCHEKLITLCIYFRQLEKLDGYIKLSDQQHKNEIRKLRDHNDHLEGSLATIKADLKAVKEINTSLTFELQNTSLDDSIDNMEVSELLVINKHLKDKNDELIMQLQSLTNAEDEVIEHEIKFADDEFHDDFNQQVKLLSSKPQPESLKQECKC